METILASPIHLLHLHINYDCASFIKKNKIKTKVLRNWYTKALNLQG